MGSTECSPFSASAVANQDEIEEIMEDDEIRAVRVDGERVKLKMYVEVNLSDAELLRDGAVEFSLETERYGGKPITMSSSEKGAKSGLLKCYLSNININVY